MQITSASQPALDARAYRRQARKENLHAVLGSKLFVIGACIVGFWVACAFVGSIVAPYSPLETEILQKLRAPSSSHWFGTDALGRDVLSRVLAGARGILVISVAAALLGTVLGTILGLVTGYFQGLVDDVLSRLIDAFLALPVVVLALLVLVATGPSPVAMVAVIGCVFAPMIARTVRATVLGEARLEYVEAAQLRDERASYVMFGEILPNVMGTVIVEFTVRFGYAIFAIATLSFLGVGIQPPSPDWGVQVYEHYALLSGGIWWPTVFPAAAIASLVVGINLALDGLAGVLGR